MSMKRILSTAAFLILIVAIAAMAVYALNGVGAAAPAVVPGSASVTAPASEPAATNKYNFIAMPLDASDSITPFKASGLATYHGGSVKKVTKWDASSQTYQSYTPGVSPPSDDFDLEVGGAYFLLLDSTSSGVLSLVGDVPEQGSVSFALVAGTASDCAYNALSLPLDQDSITNAQELASAITGTKKVTRWDATSQTYASYTPGVSPPSDNFDAAIGYPYFVCVDNTAPAQWP